MLSNQKQTDCYSLLTNNPIVLQKMAEFVASYRIYMAGWNNHSFFHQQVFYDSLYRAHINPVVKKLIPINDPRMIKKFNAYINNILIKLLSSPEHNDQWAISLIVASIQQSSHEWPLRRPLRHELAIHLDQNFFYFCRESLNKRSRSIKQNKVTYQSVCSGLAKRTDFIVENIPEYNGQDVAAMTVIRGATLMLAFYIYVVLERPLLAGLSFLSPLLVLKLWMLLSALRPSYLAYNNMPNKLNIGLEQEIKACIDVGNHSRQASRRDRNHATDCDYSPPAPMHFSNAPFYTLVPSFSYYSNAEEEGSETKNILAKKNARTANQNNHAPAIEFKNEIKEPLNVYTWVTEKHGVIVYEEAKATRDLVSLWSLNRSHDGEYVSFFPRTKLKGDPHLIEEMGTVANVGRLGRAVNQAGYVKIDLNQKKCKKHYEHAVFKLKLSPRSEFGIWRSLVKKTSLHSDDKPTANRPTLVEVGSPYVKKRKNLK